MSAVKVGAHPMLVAVAMGLLGPGALVEDEESADSLFSIEAPSDPIEPDPEPTSPEDFARIEDLWYEVRTKV